LGTVYFGSRTDKETSYRLLDQYVAAGGSFLDTANNYAWWVLGYVGGESETLLGEWIQEQRYSYIRPRPAASFAPQIAANDDLLDYCRNRGITMLAYSPLLGGAYTRAGRSFPEQYLGPDTDARLPALNAVAEEVGATANQVVYAWMLQSDPPVIPLVAASTVEQMRENLGALEIELSADQMARLNDASA
jgi:aryl-alcohol dehydrogenase-like predicted oxidoreductase